MSTHKINQIKVQFLLVLALITLFWASFQITLTPTVKATPVNHIPTPSLADGGHTIDVG